MRNASTAASCAASQVNPATAIGTNHHALGCGTVPNQSARARQMSQATIGGTTKPCANVSERAHVPTIRAAVSPYDMRIHATTNAIGNAAWRHASDTLAVVNGALELARKI